MGRIAKWRKDEKMYTTLIDLMRKYLSHYNTPNIDCQLKDQFNSYFAWHENNLEGGHIESFGGPVGSLQNRYILAGKLVLDVPRCLPGPSDWMKPGRLASLIKKLRDIAYDIDLRSTEIVRKV